MEIKCGSRVRLSDKDPGFDTGRVGRVDNIWPQTCDGTVALVYWDGQHKGEYVNIDWLQLVTD